MFAYGKASTKELLTVDEKLQKVFYKVLELGIVDISILQGVRSKEEQNLYYLHGKSKVKWPDSKHNTKKKSDKSQAVDACPYINGKASFNNMHCCFLAGIIFAVAASMGIKIRWGGNWNMDHEPITGQEFQDLVHYEIYT